MIRTYKLRLQRTLVQEVEVVVRCADGWEPAGMMNLPGTNIHPSAWKTVNSGERKVLSTEEHTGHAYPALDFTFHTGIQAKKDAGL